MNDLERGYLNLADEADRVRLASAAEVRRRGDRRVWIRRTVTGVAVVVVLAGAAAGTRWVSLADGTPSPADSAWPTAPAPSTAASSSVTPPGGSPTPSGSATPRTDPSTIPDSAFLQKADSVDGDHIYDAADPALMLPPLCGATFASDSAVRQRAGSLIVYWKPGTRVNGNTPEGTFRQTITTYQPGSAGDFIRQVRGAVDACPTEQRDGNTYRNKVLEAPRRGDESVLLQVSYPMMDNENRPTGGTEIRLAWIVRIGDVVMILYEAGYERGWSADRATVDEYATKAVVRLREWLR